MSSPSDGDGRPADGALQQVVGAYSVPPVSGGLCSSSTGGRRGALVDIGDGRDCGLLYQCIELGDEGRRPAQGATVTAHVRGECAGSTFIDGELQWTLGHCALAHLPAGIDKAVSHMHTGERSRVSLAPHWAYGTGGCDEYNIPAGATLVFHIHVTAFDKCLVECAASGAESSTSCATAVSAVDTDADNDTRPWHERQPEVIWHCVLNSGHVGPADANRCMLVCRQWRASIADSPPLCRLRVQHKALQLVFNGGYVEQSDAYSCMQVCRQWRDYVNGAKRMWHCIQLGFIRSQTTTAFAPGVWCDRMANAIAAKRPKIIVFDACFGYAARYRHSHAERRHVAAVLQSNTQLEHVEFRRCDVTFIYTQLVPSLYATQLYDRMMQ